MKASTKKTRRTRSRRHKPTGARPAALEALEAVIVDGRSLATARGLIDGSLDSRERALAMELVNGVLRWRYRLEALLAKLLRKPLRSKDRDIELLLLLALYELMALRTPEYAVVSEAVELSRQLGKPWAASLVNAVLRGFIRDRQKLVALLEQDAVARSAHPQWLIDCLASDWPASVEQILEANNERPPMWLRVNRSRISVDEYRARLAASDIEATPHPLVDTALKLTQPVDVSRLPGFDTGLVSVQDAAAQLAAVLLGAKGGERILDLCAAPGGKTCQVLESAAGIDMTAVELDPQRMQMLAQNLERLGLNASLIVGDAASVDGWWDRKQFDRILVDAPCSASGVIRRHPDIKSLRQVDDLENLAGIQQQILQQAWRMLKPGGILLYVTCSVFRQENERQIEQLLSEQPDAVELELNDGWGVACARGRQLLPGEMAGDGFYFACVEKRAPQS